jgi:hypothetical protein
MEDEGEGRNATAVVHDAFDAGSLLIFCKKKL